MVELIKEYLIKGDKNIDSIEHDVPKCNEEPFNTKHKYFSIINDVLVDDIKQDQIQHHYYNTFIIDDQYIIILKKENIDIYFSVNLSDDTININNIGGANYPRYRIKLNEKINNEKPYTTQFIEKEKIKYYTEKIFGKYITKKTYFTIDGITVKKNIEQYLYDLIDIETKDLLSLNEFIIEEYYNRVKGIKINNDQINNFKLLVNCLLKWEKEYYSTKKDKKQDKYNSLVFKTNKVFNKVLCKANKIYKLGYNNDYIKMINVEV